MLLNGKIYGVCFQGPQEIFGSAYGCLWQFDPSTSEYTRKFLFSNINNAANGRGPVSAPIAYNNKLYGTTSNGGTSDLGVLYEYDPVTEAYSKKDMQPIGGSYPIGEPTLYNNKLYGMTNANGAGNNGIIYSYDIAGGTLAKLYDVQNAGSNSPSGGFTVYNNKLYGVTSGGGANNVGAIIIYDPATNTVTSVAALAIATGYSVSNAPTLYNNKMYLTATAGGTSGRGTVMQFDPATNNLTKLYDCTTTPGGDGYDPKGELTVSGDKLYFIASESGNIINILELNPADNTVTKKSSYTATSYNSPVTHNGLTVVPAFIANGIANSCETYPTVVINSSNNNKWVPVLNTSGDVVAEIRANGNNLGNVNVSMYINNGPVREDGQRRLYLDRNLTITVQNTGITGNVDLRLYIKKSEYDSLKAATNSLGQPSGINSINDVAVYKNNEACDGTVNNPSVKLSTTTSNYEYGYVMAVSVNSFSSFYFASTAYTTLPVSLLSFAAQKQGNKVQLQWETANEVNAARYEVEKSTDSRSFTQIGSKAAANSSRNNYNAADIHPAKGYNYYRLKMIDLDGSFTYSNIAKVYFDDRLGLSIWPNPATDHIIIPEAKEKDRVRILDAKGAVVMNVLIHKQNEPVAVKNLSAGIYMLQLISNDQITQSRFVKQ
ncbi:MAG: T9SS type A sorting domain-containing protein [Ferruginibacter sp.]